MGLLKNKRALIVGAVNNYSIAYGIAKCMHREKAELAFTYQSEKIKERVEKIAEEMNSNIVFPCDLAYDDQINDLFSNLKNHWDKFDILVHSAAFAPSEQLEGRYIDCLTRDGFRIAHDISSYSFSALAKAAYPLMKDSKGALLTLSHIGAEKALINYNVMGLAKASLEANVRYLANCLGQDGIRVNGISAGAVRTLAASGIKNFRKMLTYGEKVSPLHRNVSTEEVGNAAAFLCSDLASGITGEILHVDAGLNIVCFPGIDVFT
ncbi:MAG TPA: enoyl-[acyl-carrier-protein] reductase FabI [Coxiellaceae bacterium]|nr:enoyl-[acyl-carrier-protein] reductase FabI [Coxiellaceae bacterium]HBS52208.1 enoyl-[acyl-carrier-protein] reductase FabI [Coxiellaceae bacterium]HBY55599.1 enoyl-[acyl-carrier-protein] reductase FabI [Coxiellaceae bacterium]